MVDPTKTVWILGAGFSKSLGGPLLADLFSEALNQKLDAAARRHVQDLAADTLYRRARQLSIIYRGGAEDGTPPVPGLPWQDAESFVAYAQEAAREADSPAIPEGSRAEVLGRIYKNLPVDLSVAQVGWMCRAYLALACWEFWAHADLTSELWQPYRRWARKMGSGDAVVSFNYDEVCESAAGAATSWRRFLAVPQPKEEHPHLSDSLFLKLHGSCLWLEDGASIVSAPLESDERAKELIRGFAGLDPSRAPAIGVPGPGKVAISNGPFSTLWDAALARIRDAESIVFMGYSLPKTDNDAKARILKAIAKNRRQCLSVHIVLGTRETSGTAIDRLVGMLQWALGDREIYQTPTDARASGLHYDQSVRGALIQVHHLFAEDFLTVYEPYRLDAFRPL